LGFGFWVQGSGFRSQGLWRRYLRKASYPLDGDIEVVEGVFFFFITLKPRIE